MAGTTTNPRVWFNADVYVAPVGTAQPTDTTTALNAALKPLGLLSEDGMTETRGDTTDDKYAWGGILVRTTRSKHKRTFKVAALENNSTVFALVNPGSTSVPATVAAVTATASTDLVNLNAHGLVAGNTVVFSALTGGAGLTAGTTYYVIATGLTTNSFKVSATAGGSAVDITTDMTAGTMTVTSGTYTRTVKVPVSDPRMFVIEMTDPAGTGAKMRRVVPRAEVTEVGDTVFSDSEMVAYELTVTVYPDSAGVLYLDLTTDPAAST